MIPQAAIVEWSNNVPWQTNEQIEQDLVICRAIVEIFTDEFLADSLAFRGGTALHKLYLHPQPRYSEDIDLVQIRPEPIKETIIRLQNCLSFLGQGAVDQKKANNTLRFRFDSEIQPVQKLRLKVEINCREHFSVFGWEKKDFKVQSQWFNGSANLTTYQQEELLGTKMRALYQRRKGRDLYDLYKALTTGKPDIEKLLTSYREYMKASVSHPPTQRQFLLNMEEKMQDKEFSGDITALLRPTEKYDSGAAYELVRKELIERI